nr:uncharacterized protein LOC119163986 [Rhipicephalus microplus]
MTKSTNSKFNDENFHRVDFYGVPKIKLRECAKTTELSSRRRAQWLRGICPEDVDESASYYRVCGAHCVLTCEHASPKSYARAVRAPNFSVGVNHHDGYSSSALNACVWWACSATRPTLRSACVPPQDLPLGLFLRNGTRSVPVAFVPTTGGFIHMNNPKTIQTELLAITPY